MNCLTCSTEADVLIVRGNNYPPLMWQFLTSENPDVLFDLTGSVMKLKLVWLGGSLERSSNSDADLTIDLANSILAWAYTTELSRELPLGRLTKYEVERWIGATQQSLVRGDVVVSLGNNPD